MHKLHIKCIIEYINKSRKNDCQCIKYGNMQVTYCTVHPPTRQLPSRLPIPTVHPHWSHNEAKTNTVNPTLWRIGTGRSVFCYQTSLANGIIQPHLTISTQSTPPHKRRDRSWPNLDRRRAIICYFIVKR